MADCDETLSPTLSKSMCNLKKKKIWPTIMHMNYWTEIPLCVCCIASACASTFLQRSDDLLNFYQSTRLPPPHLTLSFSLIQISISSFGGINPGCLG